jgi:hypothetical protein
MLNNGVKKDYIMKCRQFLTTMRSSANCVIIVVGCTVLLMGCAERDSEHPQGSTRENPELNEEVMMTTRWLYAGGNAPGEEKRKVAIRSRIDSWWKAFSTHADEITTLFAKHGSFDLPAFMDKHLKAIHPDLMWEYGPAVRKNGHRLVITPESSLHLRPLVEIILAAAPELDSWEFYSYRLPESYTMAMQTVKGRTGGDISNTRVLATLSNNNRIDLKFVAASYKSPQDEQAFNDAFVATEALLGEEVLNRWIQAVEVDRLDDTTAAQKEINDRAYHIEELNTVVSRLIEGIRAGLPDKSFYQLAEEDQKWTIWELKPTKNSDYPEQLDIFVGKSMVPEMWLHAHSGRSFDSQSFSRHGEVFCYVKLDGSKGLDEEKFEDKAAIEDAIDSGLRKEGIGCSTGGGTGLRYSYIDLAVTDLDRAAKVVKTILRDGNISKRTWILFYDSHLATEWIGIWNDTPPPPIDNELK